MGLQFWPRLLLVALIVSASGTLARADDRADFVTALNEGNKLAAADQHREAIKQFEKALAASIKVYGQDDMHTGSVLSTWANCV